ncbi:MAG TPA: hypothetical protein DCR70_10415, partial [Phycisphaerales bacterium]|nr:hypothetical protein [Phycisphaerales bacterium]
MGGSLFFTHESDRRRFKYSGAKASPLLPKTSQISHGCRTPLHARHHKWQAKEINIRTTCGAAQVKQSTHVCERIFIAIKSHGVAVRVRARRMQFHADNINARVNHR